MLKLAEPINTTNLDSQFDCLAQLRGKCNLLSVSANTNYRVQIANCQLQMVDVVKTVINWWQRVVYFFEGSPFSSFFEGDLLV